MQATWIENPITIAEGLVDEKMVEYDNSSSQTTWIMRVASEQKLANKAVRYLKSELKRADVTYNELARRMSESGMPETKASIACKLSRGAFSAAFFLAALKAADCQTVRLEDI